MVSVDAFTALSEFSMSSKSPSLIGSDFFIHSLISVQCPGSNSSQKWFWYHLCLCQILYQYWNSFLPIFSKWIIFEFVAQLIVKCVSVVNSHCHWIRDQSKVFSQFFRSMSFQHCVITIDSKCPSSSEIISSVLCEIVFSEFDFNFLKFCSNWVLGVRVVSNSGS